MKRVVVTGASGFLGRHCLGPLAARGYDVHAVSRTPGSGEGTWHDVDLLAEGAAAGLLEDVRPTHLLHLAWYAEHSRFWNAPENLDWVAASLKLLRAFQELGGRRAVLAGTCAEYDWSGDCCDSATPIGPATLYGAAKDALREVSAAYAGVVGLSLAWGRVFFAYGPGEQKTRVVASAAQALLRGEPFDCTGGGLIRDFLYAADLGDAFAALLDSELAGPVDLGSGTGLEVGNLVARLGDIAGRPDLVRLVPGSGHDEPPRIVALGRTLQSELGWMPAHTIEQGLAETLDWWRGRPPTA